MVVPLISYFSSELGIKIFIFHLFLLSMTKIAVKRLIDKLWFFYGNIWQCPFIVDSQYSKASMQRARLEREVGRPC